MTQALFLQSSIHHQVLIESVKNERERLLNQIDTLFAVNINTQIKSHWVSRVAILNICSLLGADRVPSIPYPRNLYIQDDWFREIVLATNHESLMCTVPQDDAKLLILAEFAKQFNQTKG